MIKFAFIGGTLRGYKLLLSLLNKKFIPQYAVFLKEDEHEVLKYSNDLLELAKQYNIPAQCGKKISLESLETLKGLQLDFIVVCGWRYIIDTSLNNYIKLGMLAAHDSLLPKYRGFAPINWAIINGEKETGVTIFKIQEGEIDNGSVIKQTKISIEDTDYAFDVYEKIIEATIEAYYAVFEDYLNNNILFIQQNEEQATYTCKRTPKDGKIDWNKDSNTVLNLIRALAHPYPGAYCIFDNSTYHIRKACLGDFNTKKFIGRIVGRVVKIDSAGIEVLCGEGSIKITEWENKNMNVVGSPNQNIKSIMATLM
jgi:methionyl-tRNA formyltransferase